MSAAAGLLHLMPLNNAVQLAKSDHPSAVLQPITPMDRFSDGFRDV
jgi:hypothetical protein